MAARAVALCVASPPTQMSVDHESPFVVAHRWSLSRRENFLSLVGHPSAARAARSRSAVVKALPSPEPGVTTIWIGPAAAARARPDLFSLRIGVFTGHGKDAASVPAWGRLGQSAMVRSGTARSSPRRHTHTMPRGLKRLDIPLGLAVIPVQLFPATRSIGVAFHLLHARYGTRIQMRECLTTALSHEKTVRG
jgi:hypothetical protein